MRQLLGLAGVVSLLAVLGLAAPAAAAPATVTGLMCATADTNLCIGSTISGRGAAVYSTDAAHARKFNFPGPGAQSTLNFTADSVFCLRAPGGNSDNVIVGEQNDAGTIFVWQNASNGGHYFYNPHTGLYLGVTGPDGSTVAVVPKGEFGWDLRFNGP